MVQLDSLRSSMGAFIAIDLAVVLARFAVRIKLNRLGYDDYMIAVGLVGFVIMCAFCFCALDNGFGLTDPTEIAAFANYNAQDASMYFTIAQITYVVSFPIVRLSVALVLLRITKETMPRIRLMLIASMIIVSTYALGCILVDALQCIPLRTVWAGGDGKCLSFTQLAGLGFAVSALDISSSLFYAILPVFMLFGVQIGFRTKFAILFLLGLGAVTVVISIVRLRSLVLIVHAHDLSAILALELESFVYSVLEFGISILTASLVALRPVIKYMPCGIRGRSSGRDHDRSNRSHSRNQSGNLNFGAGGRLPVGSEHNLELQDRSRNYAADSAWLSSDSESQRDILANGNSNVSGNADGAATKDDMQLKGWKHFRVAAAFEQGKR